MFEIVFDTVNKCDLNFERLARSLNPSLFSQLHL